MNVISLSSEPVGWKDDGAGRNREQLERAIAAACGASVPADRRRTVLMRSDQARTSPKTDSRDGACRHRSNDLPARPGSGTAG
jgi:hypothetical protein